jgi:NADH-quinone oxidoreductase subunit J
MLGADFVAVVQLIVYVGGILILLLFGVMLTNKITNVDIKSGTIHALPASIVLGLFAGALAAAVLNTKWKIVASPETSSSTVSLGNMLINEYALIFELLGIVLLIALIGAASMARR